MLAFLQLVARVPTCKVTFCNWDLGIDGTLLHHLRTSCVAAMVTSTVATSQMCGEVNGNDTMLVQVYNTLPY